MILIDGHLDLAMNALNWDRNLDLDVYEIRRREAGMAQKGRARGTVSLPELRKAEVAVSLATVIDRTDRPGNPLPGSACQEISYAKAQGQLAYYRVLEAQGKVRMIDDWPGLERHIAAWRERGGDEPLGFILSMEGADPIVWPGQIVSWWQDGLRVVGLAHYGISAYAHGTSTVGGINAQGRELLREMECEIVRRDGVIGVALDAWMLYPGWVKGETKSNVVGLEAVAAHIDHICQLAGNAQHAAIGSDLDGGYGTEQCPRDLDTIADLQRIPDLLRARGYAESDIRAVMHGNWLRFFQNAWAGC